MLGGHETCDDGIHVAACDDVTHVAGTMSHMLQGRCHTCCRDDVIHVAGSIVRWRAHRAGFGLCQGPNLGDFTRGLKHLSTRRITPSALTVSTVDTYRYHTISTTMISTLMMSCQVICSWPCLRETECPRICMHINHTMNHSCPMGACGTMARSGTDHFTCCKQ